MCRRHSHRRLHSRHAIGCDWQQRRHTLTDVVHTDDPDLPVITPKCLAIDVPVTSVSRVCRWPHMPWPCNIYLQRIPIYTYSYASHWFSGYALIAERSASLRHRETGRLSAKAAICDRVNQLGSVTFVSRHVWTSIYSLDCYRPLAFF